MADQKPFHETIIPVIHFIPQNPDETMLRIILHFIRITDIPKNHEVIINALEKTLARLTDKERWEGDFRETILSVRAQKEAAEKVVKYEGLLTHKELELLIEASHTFLHYESPAKLSVVPPPKEKSELLLVSISSDSGKYLDDDFGPGGVFQLCHCEWLKKFTRIPALEAKKETGETVTLVNGDTLQFVSGGWWLSEADDLTSADPPKNKKITRSEAYDLLGQNGMLGDISDEAFKDLNTIEDTV